MFARRSLVRGAVALGVTLVTSCRPAPPEPPRPPVAVVEPSATEDVTPPAARGDLEVRVAPPSAVLAPPAASGVPAERVTAARSPASADAARKRSRAAAPSSTAPADRTPPTSPQAVVASALSDRTVRVAWAPSSDETGVAGYEVLRDGVIVATAPAPPARVGGHGAGDRTCWTVRAFDRAGNRSAEGGPGCVRMPDLVPPTTPRGVVAIAAGEHEVALRWEDSSDDVAVAGYEVRRDERPCADTAATELADRELAAWTEYCYTVRARDAAGNRSGFSPPVCIRTLDTTPPAAPPDAVARAASDRAMSVSWGESSDEGGTVRYVVTRGGGEVASTADRSATEGGLRPAREYCYVVVAWDAAGNASPPSTPACGRAPDLEPPTAPGPVLAHASAADRVALAWKPADDDVGVTGYEVAVGDAVRTRVDGLLATVDGLAPSTTYCFDVRALDAAGNRSRSASRACTGTPPAGTLPGPTHVRASRKDATSVRLDWAPSPAREIVYAVYLDGNRRVGFTRETTYLVAGVKAAQAACFEVSAVQDEGRESPRSLPACTRPSPQQTASR